MDETLKIVLGYIVFFAFMGGVIFIGELISKKTSIDKELCRKLEHIATGFSWLICCYFTGATIHTLIINFVGLIILGLITFTGFMKSVERDDNDGKSYGLFYFGLSTFIVMALTLIFNTDFYYFTGISYYCMVLGDGFAPITARIFKNKNAKIINEKTLVGAITVFALSCFSAWIFSYVCGLNLTPLFIISLGALASVCELVSSNCTDNLTVEFAVFGYLVLNYYGLATVSLQIALIVALPILLLNGYKKALTNGANIISYIYFLLSAYFVGASMSTTIAVLYLLSAVVGVITVKKYNEKHHEKVKISRKAKQIIANSVVALALCAIYYLTEEKLFLYSAFAVIVEEFADSMSSDIGRISRRIPRDIIGFKQLPTGISGGVTALGSLSALVACAVALAIPFTFGVMSINIYLILIGITLIGVFIDSILGSRLQVLYKCSKCGALTESPVHCNENANYHKGVKWLDNSLVNLLSGVITALLTLGALSLIFIL